MYARLNMFKFGPGAGVGFESLVDKYAPRFRAQRGLQSVMFLVNRESGECASFSLWESREAMETGSAALAAELRQDLAGMTVEPIAPRLFEVYEPKS